MKKKALKSDGLIIYNNFGDLYPANVYAESPNAVQTAPDGTRHLMYGYYVVDTRHILGGGFRLCEANKNNPEIEREPRLYDSVAEIEALPMLCPESGEFIGYKIVFVGERTGVYAIAKLLIPADAKRTNAYGHTQCRADKVKVLDIYSCGHHYNEGHNLGLNTASAETTYTVGKMVYANGFCGDRWKITEQGIHYFMTEKDTMRWWGDE